LGRSAGEKVHRDALGRAAPSPIAGQGLRAPRPWPRTLHLSGRPTRLKAGSPAADGALHLHRAAPSTPWNPPCSPRPIAPRVETGQRSIAAMLSAGVKARGRDDHARHSTAPLVPAARKQIVSPRVACDSNVTRGA
jgi:hypothetical protein